LISPFELATHLFAAQRNYTRFTNCVAKLVAGMPDHHRDPFDRILLAQAIVESMTLVSAAKFSSYSVPLLW